MVKLKWSGVKWISEADRMEPVYCGARRGGKRSVLYCGYQPFHDPMIGHGVKSKGRYYFWAGNRWEKKMARITENLLIQQVGNDQIVFLDESTGEEVAFNIIVIDNVIAALGYFRDLQYPTGDAPPMNGVF